MLRYDRDRRSAVLVVSNFTPVARPGCRIGVPFHGRWRQILNTDATVYDGGEAGTGDRDTQPVEAHGRGQSLVVDLPLLATTMFISEDGRNQEP